MAVQLVEIAENVALYEIDNTQGYSPKTGKLLFKMQRAACESVLVAVSHLTLISSTEGTQCDYESYKRDSWRCYRNNNLVEIF